MIQKLGRFLKEEEGQDFAEYALILGAVGVVAIAGLACLLPFPAVLLSLFGLEAWRRIWVRRQSGPVPALPGLLLGIMVHIAIRIMV